MELRLEAARFDPLLDTAPDLAARLPPGPSLGTPSERYLLPQFHGPIDGHVHGALGDRGAKVVSYVPDGALLVRVPHATPDEALEDLPRLRRLVTFQPGMNVAPAITNVLRRAASGIETPLSLDVSLFPGQDPELIAERLVAAIDGLAVRFVKPGRDGGGARLTLDVPAARLAPAVGALARYPVLFVERAPVHRSYNDQSVWIVQSYDTLSGPVEAAATDPKTYPTTATVWNQGLIGEGQVVAVADTDLMTDMCYWHDAANAVTPQQVTPPAPLALDTSHRRILALNGTKPGNVGAHGTFRHGTHVAGSVSGDASANLAGIGGAGHDAGDGMAPGAKIIFEDVGPGVDADCLGTIEVDSIEDLLEQEWASGAHISTNSWGGDSTEFGAAYSARTREVDAAVWAHEELLVLFAAGNDGAAGFNDYAACKSCVAVGASENHEPSRGLDPENVASFSSQGPAADGRLKPDVLAPGDRVFSGRYRTLYVADPADPQCSPSDPSVEVCFPGPSIGGCYLTFTAETCAPHALRGTSMASPTAAGMAALAREYFTDGFYPTGFASPADSLAPSAALLKAVLVNAGRNMTGVVSGAQLADAPSDVQGWGRVLLDDALYFDGDARRTLAFDVANAAGLATGETATYTMEVTGTGEPLEVTIVWTDPPAAALSAPALVNDLDLEVVAPDGTVYRGNQWTADDVMTPGDKESAPDPAGTDALNNVEGVLVKTPQAGHHTIRVVAANVPGYQAVLTQGYALVATGELLAGRSGAVPDGDGVPGTTLAAAKGAGGNVELSWGRSCLASDGDFAVYEGALGDFASHEPATCSTGGAMQAAITPAAGGRYFLVAPHNDRNEGSLGTGDGGAERAAGPSPCLPRLVEDCP